MFRCEKPIEQQGSRPPLLRFGGPWPDRRSRIVPVRDRIVGGDLGFLFWRTDARYRPGKLLGVGLLIYGSARFSLELVRQPDRGLEHLSWGLTMGQTLSVPIIVAGLYFTVESLRRGLLKVSDGP